MKTNVCLLILLVLCVALAGARPSGWDDRPRSPRPPSSPRPPHPSRTPKPPRPSTTPKPPRPSPTPKPPRPSPTPKPPRPAASPKPPSPPRRPPPPRACRSVLDVINRSPALDVLAAAVKAANLTSVLGSTSYQATVFAPTDRAFYELARSLRVTLKALLKSSSLKATLLYHVVPGKGLKVASLTDGQKLTTASSGRKLTVDFTTYTFPRPRRNVTLLEIKGVKSTADVLVANLVPCPGKTVVHIVDNVLLFSR